MMIRILFLALIVNILTFTARGETYVLCLGISNYSENDANLTQTTKDAKQFKAVMENHTDKISILTSKYADRENVLRKIREMSKLAKRGDNFILFFSGHGYPGGIVAYDRAISYQEINDILKQSEASAKICLIDACHSGSVTEARQRDSQYNLPSSDNTIYLMSCKADEKSGESDWVGHGFFTQALLKGIRGKADANGDKKITVRELFTFIFNDVRHSTEKMNSPQHPQLIGSKNVADAVIVDWK